MLSKKEFIYERCTKAASASSQLKMAQIGMAGDRDMRLCGTLCDGSSLKAEIGPEIEHLELLKIAELMQDTDKNEIANLASSLKTQWNFICPKKAKQSRQKWEEAGWAPPTPPITELGNHL